MQLCKDMYDMSCTSWYEIVQNKFQIKLQKTLYQENVLLNICTAAFTTTFTTSDNNNNNDKVEICSLLS